MSPHLQLQPSTDVFCFFPSPPLVIVAVVNQEKGKRLRRQLQPASQQTGPQPPQPESASRHWLNPARPEPVAGTRRHVRQPSAAEHALAGWPSPCPAGWHSHHGCNPSWAQISRTPGSAATRFWNSFRCFIWLRSTDRPLAQRRMTYR